jgi:hypothetical protein
MLASREADHLSSSLQTPQPPAAPIIDGIIKTGQELIAAQEEHGETLRAMAKRLPFDWSTAHHLMQIARELKIRCGPLSTTDFTAGIMEDTLRTFSTPSGRAAGCACRRPDQSEHDPRPRDRWWAPRAMQEGPNNQDIEFALIAKSVHDMWVQFCPQHNMPLT